MKPLEYSSTKTLSDRNLLPSIEAISLSPDGSLLALASANRVLVLEFQRYALKHEIEAKGAASALAWMSTEMGVNKTQTNHLVC